MKNPYHETIPADTISVSRKVVVAGITLFLLLLVLPSLVGFRGLAFNDSPDEEAATLRERLRSFESRFSGMALFSGWRDFDQALLVRWFREGNNRVLIGKDGWLYYRADVDAVVGKGPRYEEPPSVARDPGLEEWQSPLPVIGDFSEQLKERGIHLILVPVPTKAMIHPVGLGAGVESALPLQFEEILDEFRSNGVDVVALEEIREDWMKQDTHWTPAAMQSAAGAVAGRINAAQGSGEFPFEMQAAERGARGDLVAMLGIAGAKNLFPKEEVTLNRIVSKDAGTVLEVDPESRVVVLGDSFVNVFDDPSLGFASSDENEIGAGFAEHLAFHLQERIAVLASNGGGASTVRKRFAELLGKRKANPETVVWVLSARDLFLAEIPARRARVEWQFIELRDPTEKPETRLEPGEVIFTATLLEKSRIGDESERNSAAYDSAIYSGIFGDISVESGTYEKKEAWVFLWAAKNRKLLETAHLKVGSRYRLKLVPFPDEGAVSTATQLDDFFRGDLARYYAAEAEEAE